MDSLDFLFGEVLLDEEMIVVEGGNSVAAQGGSHCGRGCDGGGGDHCGHDCRPASMKPSTEF